MANILLNCNMIPNPAACLNPWEGAFKNVTPLESFPRQLNPNLLRIVLVKC